MVLLGLDTDSRPSEITEGYYSFGKNGLDYIDKTVSNEFGFRKLDVLVVNTIIGIIETGDKAVIFSTDNTISEIGLLDLTTETYVIIVNDSTKTYKFNFNISNPIKGEFQKNFNNELIIVFKDNVQFPKIINVTNNQAITLNDYLLFPSWTKCQIETVVSKGGNVTKGCYIPVLRYIKEGLFTDYFVYGSPCYIGNDNNSQITVKVTNIDSNYDKIQLCFIVINNGITKVVQLDKVNAYQSSIITFNGSYKDELDFETFFAVTPYYTNFKAITQLNDELYLGNLEEYNQNKVDYHMQKASLNAKLKWKSTLIKDVVSNFDTNSDYLSGKYKGFFHQEVYCFFIVGNLRNGRKTKAYIIANDAVVGDALSTSSYSTLGVTGSKYQLEDTIDLNKVNFTEKTGAFGYWENQNEVYPTSNIEGFGNPFVGFSGNKVKHFKTPSHNFCYTNFYADSNLEYGSRYLDILNVFVDSFVIPAEIASEVVSYELCYAKRQQVDITNIGQSLYMLGSNANSQENLTNMTSTGGNFNWDGYGTDGSDNANKNNYMKEKLLRFHSFDMLYYKVAIKPDIIINQLKLVKKIVDDDKQGTISGVVVNGVNVGDAQQSISGVLNDFGDFDKVFYKERSIYMVFDYTLGKEKTTVSGITTLNKARKINNFKFNPNNSYSGDIDNRLAENVYTAELSGVDLTNSANWIVRSNDNTQSFKGTHELVRFPRFETTYLSNLIRVVNDVYNSYYSQTIISTQVANTGSSSAILYNGDCFINYYSFVTFGKRDIFDKANGIDSSNRFIHRFVCESASNINLRYQKIGDIYTNFYPNSNGSWIRNLDKNLEPNNFGYDREFNKLNEQNISIYNPYVSYKYKYPFSIIRSSQLNNTFKTERSWRNFAPLDSFEMPKNYDEIINLQGMGDNLLIHMRNMLFVTRDKGRLGLDNLNIVLGSGNIFEFNPIKVEENNLGIAGTKQDIGLLVSPLGYHFIDNGIPYIYSQGLKSLSNKMSNFFVEYLKTNKNNPLNDDGIIFGYDKKYKRILMSLKNNQNSFTISYSLEKQNWTFFHDYIADMYFHSRTRLYSVKNNKIFINDEGVMGNYYEPDFLDAGTYSKVIHPFFIDIVFKQKEQSTLTSVNWVTDSINSYLKQEVINKNTLTHLTIRNDEQHSGRIFLTGDNWYESKFVKMKDVFSFNNFNNIIVKGIPVNLESILKDYLLRNEITNINWYEIENMFSYYHVVRFEYDNKVNNIILLKEAFVNQENQ